MPVQTEYNQYSKSARKNVQQEANQLLLKCFIASVLKNSPFILEDLKPVYKDALLKEEDEEMMDRFDKNPEEEIALRISKTLV